MRDGKESFGGIRKENACFFLCFMFYVLFLFEGEGGGGGLYFVGVCFLILCFGICVFSFRERERRGAWERKENNNTEKDMNLLTVWLESSSLRETLYFQRAVYTLFQGHD